jgi:putative sigma-54 modulation protein
MKVRILGTKIDLTIELKDYIQEKMDMLEKYLGDIKATNCDVEVALVKGKAKHGKIYRAEVNLELPGSLLRVEKEEESLYKAIDKVKDHLVRSIKRYKEKK